MGKGDGREKGLCPRRKRSFTKKEQKKNSTISRARKGSLATFFVLGEILAFPDVSGARFFNSDPLKWELIEEVDKLKSCQPFLSELQEEKRSSQSPRQLHNETLDC